MTLRYRLLPTKRRKQLKALLSSKPGLRFIEAHNGLSGLIGMTTSILDEQGQTKGFDGLWVSSLTDSAAKGHPDTEVIDTSSRLQTIQELLQVTNKPIIVDGDTGGQPTQFEYFCSKLENLGVSAVIIEDKKFPKRNSLEKDAIQNLEDPKEFATKVNRAKEVCLSDDFMIFTRIESFIAGRGLDDAIMRANIYLDSKADGILIHSNAKTPDDIYAFMAAYKKLCHQKNCYKPIVCVPTTYNQVHENELFQKGFNIVIYANHPLRAAYKAMKDTCTSILEHGRSHEASQEIASIKDIMNEVGFPDVKSKDAQYTQNPLPVIILGSGKPSGFTGTDMAELPVGNIPLAGLPLLERQLNTLKSAGFSNTTVLSGYKREKLPKLNYKEIINNQYTKTKVGNSLMMARNQFDQGFIMLFGDIIFDEKLLRHYLTQIESDILLLVDNSFNLSTRQTIKPTTDLVILGDQQQNSLRKPNRITEIVTDIGTDIPLDKATHEFIGMAKFSSKGAEQLQVTYDRLIHATPENDAIDFNMLIRAMIQERANVQAIAVNYGWSEVHTLNDIALIEKEINRSQSQQVLP